MAVNNLNIGIGGEAGAGVMEAGLLLAKAILRMGLYSFTSVEYPSLIKGGHNFTRVRISAEPLYASSRELDLLIALDEQTIQLHKQSLHSGSAVIYDSDLNLPQDDVLGNIQYYPIPMMAIAEEIQGPVIIRNTAGLGAALSLIGADLGEFNHVLQETFASKGDDVLSINIKAAKLGNFSLKKNNSQPFDHTLARQEQKANHIIASGNDALALGALRSGVQFVSIYPMTPITGLLEFFAKHQTGYNLLVQEPEDEIAAINNAIGASFAGTRALTATSGGGFCLMTEGVSLSGMSETPLVIVEGMRGGPSTGLPTKTEQADLRFVLHGGHGDFPKVVMAPGDAVECFQEIFRAFNIAEIYQLPVIILTDHYLATSSQTVELPENTTWPISRGDIVKIAKNQNFARYAYSENGVSPRSLPGQADLIFTAASDEHDEQGFAIDDPSIRNLMMRKRMHKIDSLAVDLPEPVLYGPPQAAITLVGYGSTKGPIFETLAVLAAEGIVANFLHLLYLQPFPAYTVATVFKQAPSCLVVENNYTAQLAGLIREKTGYHIKEQLLRFDGLPFTAQDIITRVKEIIPGSSSAIPDSQISHQLTGGQ